MRRIIQKDGVGDVFIASPRKSDLEALEQNLVNKIEMFFIEVWQELEIENPISLTTKVAFANDTDRGRSELQENGTASINIAIGLEVPRGNSLEASLEHALIMEAAIRELSRTTTNLYYESSPESISTMLRERFEEELSMLNSATANPTLSANAYKYFLKNFLGVSRAVQMEQNRKVRGLTEQEYFENVIGKDQRFRFSFNEWMAEQLVRENYSVHSRLRAAKQFAALAGLIRKILLLGRKRYSENLPRFESGAWDSTKEFKRFMRYVRNVDARKLGKEIY